MKKPFAPVLLLTSLLVLACTSFPVAAHQVRYEISRGEAVVVSLSFGDGTPLVNGRYDILAEDEEAPYQSGHTDHQGRIIFLPPHRGDWRVRVFTGDGHGVDFTLEAGPDTAEPPDLEKQVVERVAGPPAAEPPDPGKPFVERFAGPVLGVGIIFFIFGLFALFARRRQ